MGCCETREKIYPNEYHFSQELTKPVFTPSMVANKHIEVDFEDLIEEDSQNKGVDLRADDIEIYLSQLISSFNWTTHAEKPDCVIKTKLGSAFNENLPVTLGLLDFGFVVPSKEVINLLYESDLRMSWDQNLESVKLIQNSPNVFFLRLLKKFPFKSREFILKVVVKTQSNQTSVIYYSVPNKDFPVCEERERGECLFGMAKILERNSSTLFMQIEQVDNKQNPKPSICNLAATELTQWLSVFKRAVHDYHSVNTMQ